MTIMDFGYPPVRATTYLTAICSATFLAYIICLGVYRLYFHPLAEFPGPKLAGLTRWYEFYYEIVQKGQYVSSFFDAPDLMTIDTLSTSKSCTMNMVRGGPSVSHYHCSFSSGPIIRVCPDELHIRDSDYYEELFVKSGKLDKPWTFCNRFGTSETFFSTPSHDYHKMRRGAVAQFL